MTQRKRRMNKRHGLVHLHSGAVECGIAYWASWGDPEKSSWLPCSKLLNHSGSCGYADNSAY